MCTFRKDISIEMQIGLKDCFALNNLFLRFTKANLIWKRFTINHRP